MKIEYEDDKTIVYLYRYKLNLENIKELGKEIKNIFIKLIKCYRVDLRGYLKVSIFCHNNYGYILEVENIDNDYDYETIELKLIIYDNCDFYFRTNDYFLVNNFNKIYYSNSYFYVNVDEISDILKYIEHGSIVHDFDTSSGKLIGK